MPLRDEFQVVIGEGGDDGGEFHGGGIFRGVSHRTVSGILPVLDDGGEPFSFGFAEVLADFDAVGSVVEAESLALAEPFSHSIQFERADILFTKFDRLSRPKQ